MHNVRSLDDPDSDHEMVVEPDPLSGSSSGPQPLESTANGIPHHPHTPLRHSHSLQHLGSIHQAYGSVLQTAVAPTPYLPSPLAPHIYYHPSFPLPQPAAPFAFQTQHTPFTLAQSLASARVEHLEALRDSSAPAKRPRPAYATSGVHAVVAARFVDGLFTDVKLDKVAPHQPGLWHQHTTTEDRILVVLRAVEAAGFSLPDFLLALFTPGFNEHSTVYHRVASFLRMRSPKAPRPVDVVAAMYKHPKARKPGLGPPLFPSLPRHAWSPQDRVLVSRGDSPPSDAVVTTTEALMLDFALKLVLRRIDEEADELLSPQHGLVYSAGTFSWALLQKFSMASKQTLFAQHAPALFAIMSTVAVNRDHRKRLEHNAHNSGSARAPDELDVDADVEVLPEAVRLEADSKAPPTPRDPWLAVTAMIMMLLVFRYRRAIIFPLFVGVLLFTCNAHRDVFRILNRIGLSVAYSTCLDKLSVLAQGQSQMIIEWARRFQAGSFYFQLVYDNVNKRRTVWQKTIAQREEFQSGTAATLIKLEDVPPGAMNIERLEKHARDHPRSTLTYDELREDIDWQHLGGIGAATILRIWLQWVPALARHRADVEDLFLHKYQKHRLPLRKSEIRTLRCSAIDESTTEGSNRVLNDVLNQLRIALDCLATCFLFVCGDQLTIDRVRKLKVYFRKMKTPVERRAWARPIIQLWHMKWAWQKVIVKLNWSNVSQEFTYGLRFDCFRLERQKYNPTKCDYHQTHHLLRDTFEAQVLEALRLLCQEKTGVVYPPTTRLLDGLAKYFGSGGAMADYDFSQLAGLADQVYNRYICLAAHEDALGYTARNETVYGPSLEKR